MDRKDLNNLYKYDQIGGNTSYSPPDKEDNQVMKRNRFLQKENDKLKLKFDYNIHENPNKCNTDSGDFINVIGDILTIEVEKDGNSRENRTDSAQKSNT